jgi:hypothetical protein
LDNYWLERRCRAVIEADRVRECALEALRLVESSKLGLLIASIGVVHFAEEMKAELTDTELGIKILVKGGSRFLKNFLKFSLIFGLFLLLELLQISCFVLQRSCLLFLTIFWVQLILDLQQLCTECTKEPDLSVTLLQFGLLHLWHAQSGYLSVLKTHLFPEAGIDDDSISAISSASGIPALMKRQKPAGSGAGGGSGSGAGASAMDVVAVNPFSTGSSQSVNTNKTKTRLAYNLHCI